MRKYILYVFVLTAVFLVSCNNIKNSKFRADNGIVFDTISVNRQHFLEGDTANSSCKIEIDFVYPASSKYADVDSLQRIFINRFFGSAYDSLSAQEAVDKYVASYIANYEKDALTFKETLQGDYNTDIFTPVFGHDDDMNNLPEKFYSYNESLSDSVFYNAYGILSFQVKQSNNKGGDAVFNSYQNYVINLETMDMLTENDIFKPGYDTALRQYLQTSLMEQNSVKSINDLEDLGYFGIAEIIPNKNFLVNNKGIRYTFNKGEYSAYQLNAPEVFIPYNSVNSLLRDNSIVSNLAK